MHLAIALITYNSLIRIAKAGGPPPGRRSSPAPHGLHIRHAQVRIAAAIIHSMTADQVPRHRRVDRGTRIAGGFTLGPHARAAAATESRVR